MSCENNVVTNGESAFIVKIAVYITSLKKCILK